LIAGLDSDLEIIPFGLVAIMRKITNLVGGFHGMAY
jgi:hypothetical protein